MHKSKKLWLLAVLALVASLLIATPILSQGNCNGNGRGNGQNCDQPGEQPQQNSVPANNGNNGNGNANSNNGNGNANSNNGNGNGNANGNNGNGNANANGNNANGNNGNGNGNNGNGNGNNGNGNANSGNSGQPETVVETAAPVQTEAQPEALIVTEAPAQQSQTLLGCQKNNPDRLDCSSLSVRGVCQGGVAMFTITNTGEPGNGDMRAGTGYRLYVDGVLVESGTVQIAGGATMQISWSGGGNVTLEADQQVGHPGNSRPRASLNCGAPVEEPTEIPTEEPTTEVPTEVPTTEVPTEEPTTEVPTEEPTTEVPTEEPTTEVPTEEPTTEVPVEEPELVGDIVCNLDGTATATITNIGGDMTGSVSYVELGMDGSERSSGSIQLESGASTSITIAGDSTLNVGGGMLLLYVSGCLPPTEPTEPAGEPYLIGDVVCVEDGTTYFIITNIGGDMTEPVSYYVVDINGWIENEGTFQLEAGQSVTIHASARSAMAVDGWFALYSDCGDGPTEQPYLIGDVTCDGVNGPAVYTITNVGTVDMTNYVYWYIIAADGSLEDSGYFLLEAGQSTVIYGSGGSALGVDGWFALFAQCEVPTEEPTPTEPPTEEPTEIPTEPPTEEPTEVPTELPTDEPTEEPTPTEPPTEEPTEVPTELPTDEPTEEPTEVPTVVPTPTNTVLGCQKNNPGRLDCSSLNVSGMCVGDVAVFTIRNTGEAGNGDMRAPTEYRIYVDGVLVETGLVDLDGATAMQVSYAGGGRVTLQADQQVGHPGNSRPHVTLSCGG